MSNGMGKGAIVLSPAAIAWAMGNGLAAEVEGAGRVRNAWQTFHRVTAYSGMPKAKLEALSARYATRQAKLADALRAKG